ncbi:cadherin-like domain-containing protein [[Phormidium] sp. ETS-05]|uniref:cadherin-like domain-containing protein n=1 Tax=[Phormidium] sp. ETS-05 TaxID=222819 RepID=UPI0018EEF560|nr:FG-GAP-like repeat-containing protein [[Phormidium] sp. ETS-05]
MTGNSYSVSLLLGDGSGSFNPHTTYAVASHPLSITPGDFNGDGHLDLAVVTGNSYNVSVLLNTTITVTAVTATTADGSYKAGDTIAITVTFSEAVNVTGTPTLTLNTGANATYSSGSGTDTLTFNYTVAPGDNTADLDYSSTTALALSGGTIRNTGNTTDAILTLPTPGAANSLGANKNIIIDGIAPTVTIEQAGGQTDPAPTSPINYTVTFSEPVTGFDGSDISFTGSTAGGTLTPTITGSGTTYNVAVSGMTTSGTVIPTVIANAATDAAGNPSAASTSTDNSVTYNTIPTVSNISKTGDEDNIITFSAADFTSAFSDADGDSLNTIQITSLPANGTLLLNGVNVTLNQDIGPANIFSLTFTPTADYNGSTSFTWNGSDGSNYATPATVNLTINPVNNLTINPVNNLTINPVNDPPSFTATNPIPVNEDSGTQTITNWATFNPRPADEASQTATYTVSNISNPDLFSAIPTVDSSGTLSYTPTADANGISTLMW